MKERWAEVEALFAAALDTPPAEREPLLTTRCTDESLRAEVRRLLARHDSLATGFLTGLDRARSAELLDDSHECATIGRYEIVGRVGRGATGVVYLAHDPSLGRRVALKLLAPHLSARPDAVRRFADEARTASGLDHPHIATIHEISHTEDGRIFITMAYYDGETLRARIGQGPLPLMEAVRLATQLADALGAAHAKAVVHRDVKPENVVLTARGARLVDFGIATVTGQNTRDVLAGTVAYMSPEQTRGADVGPPADCWALGVVMYEMLTGVRPFRGDDPDQLIAAIRADPAAPVRLLRPEVPPALARVVERCLEKDPARRYASGDALLVDLAPSVTAGRSRGRRVAVTAGVVALAAVAVFAASSWNSTRALATVSPSGDAIAYDLYTQGRFRMQRRTRADLEQAAILFREAIARDSSFASAHVGLADVYMAGQEARPADRFERAKPLLVRALALDSNLGAAHKAAGWSAMWYDRDWSTAERHYQRALEIDSSDVSAYHGYAALLSATGRTRESLAMTRRALVLDPVGSYTLMHIGLHLYWDRRYEEAIAVLKRVLEMDTSFRRAHAVLGRALLAVGRHEEAIAQLRQDNTTYASLEPRALLAYGLGVAGQKEEARANLAQYEARARGTYVNPLNLAAIHLGLGQISAALDWLERVPDDRGLMFFPLSETMYDVLHGIPRFERVLERLNLRHAAISARSSTPHPRPPGSRDSTHR